MTSQERKEAINLLMNLLSIPSITGTGGEFDLANFIHTYISEAGIDASIDLVSSFQANVIAKVGNLENRGKSMVWNGHLDTVPYGDSALWKFNPATPVLKDNFIFCRGAVDMKSGLASMLYAMTSLYKKKILPKTSLLFIATCDEEKSGSGARHVVNSGLMEQSEMLFIAEPTGNTLGVAQKGCLLVRFFVKGLASHSAYPETGISAISQMVALFSILQRKIEVTNHPLLGKASVVLTKIVGGTSHNMIPDSVEALVDIRFNPDLTSLEIKSIISKAIIDCSIDATFEILNERAPIVTRHSQTILKEALNKNIEETGVRYFTDASILAYNKRDFPVFLYGPGVAQLAHQPNECVSINEYLDAIHFYQQIYIRYSLNTRK